MPIEIINKENGKIVELSNNEYSWLLEGFRQFACHFGLETWGHTTSLDCEKKFKELRTTYTKLTGEDICK